MFDFTHLKLVNIFTIMFHNKIWQWMIYILSLHSNKTKNFANFLSNFFLIFLKSGLKIGVFYEIAFFLCHVFKNRIFQAMFLCCMDKIIMFVVPFNIKSVCFTIFKHNMIQNRYFSPFLKRAKREVFFEKKNLWKKKSNFRENLQKYFVELKKKNSLPHFYDFSKNKP